MRDWLKFDQNVGRLRGGKFAEAAKRVGYNKDLWYFKLRSMLKKWPLGLYAPGDALISTIGISSEDEKKAQLIGELEELCPAEALLSLKGDNSDRAKEIREKYKNDKRLRWAYKKSIEGLLSKEE